MNLLKFVLVVALAASTVSRRPGPRKPARKLSNAQLEEVEETIRIIEAGDREVSAQKPIKEFVLVVGNTGAGKTTIVKFLAQTELLESWNAGDGYLIRDAENKISSDKTTIVSHTLFPDLIIDSKTGTAFYDLPGFSDTRNASIEIANSWFMKRVADKAERVKILFIVNYSSLREGESRNDFKNLLDHATNLIKNPKKFRKSIAMVATKAETEDDEKIRDGIAEFLDQFLDSVDQVFEEEDKLQRVEDLLKILTNPSRVEFLKKPQEAGRLSSFPEFMDKKASMLSMIRSLKFTPKEEQDFGVSISPPARLLLQRVQAVLYARISKAISQISDKIKSVFEGQINQSPLLYVGAFYKLLDMLQNSISGLDATTNRTEFYQKLYAIAAEFKVSDISMETSEIRHRDQNLEFFEKVSESRIQAPIQQWLKLLKDQVRALGNSVKIVASKFNIYVEEALTTWGSQLELHFRNRIEESDDKSQTAEELVADLELIEKTVEALRQAPTYNAFVQGLEPLGEQAPVPASLQKMPHDVSLASESDSPFQLIAWTKPLEKVAMFLEQEKINLELSMQQTEHEQKLKVLNQDVIQTRADLEAKLNQEQEKIADLLEKAKDVQRGLEQQLLSEAQEFQKNVTRLEELRAAQMAQLEQDMDALQTDYLEKIEAERRDMLLAQEAILEKQKELERLHEAEVEGNEMRTREHEAQTALQEQILADMQESLEEQKAQNAERVQEMMMKQEQIKEQNAASMKEGMNQLMGLVQMGAMMGR